ncbi:MAG: hypothetical protein K8R73_08540 [Clostridiales bacterium]|nr:hypothetical protein [Clostridiales bacterium]
MLNFIRNRKNHVILAFLLVFSFLGYSLYDLTITQGEYYYQRSVSNRIKKVETLAKRGEIFDRNGNLLATNEVGFGLELNSSIIPTESFSEIAIEMYDFLEKQNEDHLEFPIYIENGEYKYRFDESISKWLADNGYDDTWTAEEVFMDVRGANYIDPELSNYEAYRILYNQGRYMPISTSRMIFMDEVYKINFLKMYGLDQDISAKEAFGIIRNRSDFRISSDYDDYEAYKIIVLRHAIKEKGFLKYEPISIASSVSQETAVLVQEKGYEFPGLSVIYQTVRLYPEKSTAAHILGYMGPIATEAEIDSYVKTLNYNQNQIIGKTGIEGVYETTLHGENGYKYIEVDVYGKFVSEVDEAVYGLDTKSNKSGDDIYLTIDLPLQDVLEDSLENAINAIKVGGTFKSDWGDYKFKPYPKVETAAGVVVDVNTGEVLAMASYPSYDVNLFSTGISQEDYNALNPVNKRNPIAARPLVNIVTMMAVQPGSIYKMVTGYSALEQGLNPYQKLFSSGYVEIGNQRFGCWFWNDYGGIHGPTDLFKALEVSCNYYFFNVATGKDFNSGRTLDFEMGPVIMTESSKQFGLDVKTGIEIGEVATGTPEPEKKKRTIQALLKTELKRIAKDYFPEELIAEEEDLNALVDEIISWSDENPSRGALINKLLDLGSSEDYFLTEKLADLIKYDYFNLMKWYESDTLNLSIGQGDHTYTPIQIARYIATIANGGYLKELTLIKKIGDELKEKNTGEQLSMDEKDLLQYIQKGMRQMINSPTSSVRSIFEKFPVAIAGKTGTAEKAGLMPPLDEVAYFTEYLKEIDNTLSLEEVNEKTLEIIKKRSEEMVALEKSKNEAETDIERDMLGAKLNALIERDYLNKGNAMRDAIKTLSGDKLTDEDLNQFRLPYDNYSWFVSYAPYENPEIAVVIFIPQGGTGIYSAPVAREVYAEYFKLEPPIED